MDDKLTTAGDVAEGTVAAASVFLLKETNNYWAMVGTHCLSLVDSAFNALKQGVPDERDTIEQMHYYVRQLSRSLVLPSMATQVYVNDGFRPEIALLHVGGGAVVFLLSLIKKEWAVGLQNVLVAVNALSLGYASAIKQEYSGVGAAVTYALSYFGLGGSVEARETPGNNYFSYGVALFQGFCAKALRN